MFMQNAERLYALACADPVAALARLTTRLTASGCDFIKQLMDRGMDEQARQLVATLVDSEGVWERVYLHITHNEKYAALDFLLNVWRVGASDTALQRVFVALCRIYQANGPRSVLRDYLRDTKMSLKEADASAFLAAAQDNPELFRIVPSRVLYNDDGNDDDVKTLDPSFVMLKARLDAVQPDPTDRSRDLRNVVKFVAAGHHAAAVHLCLVSESARADVTRCAAARERWEAAPDRLEQLLAHMDEMCNFVDELSFSLPSDSGNVWQRDITQDVACRLERVGERAKILKPCIEQCTPQAALAELALRLPGSVYAEHCAVLMARGLSQPVILRVLAHGQPELSAALPEQARVAIEMRTRRVWLARARVRQPPTALGNRARADE